MKYFLDTEFIEDGSTIDLISIGIVAEDGREFYRVSTEAKLHLAGPWVRENVLPHLPPYDHQGWQNRDAIVRSLHDFVLGGGGRVEFWAYYADYDWVALCQLFGTMINLPDFFPKFCMDLKQWSVMLGSPRHPPDPEGEHNALVDARWNRELYALLQRHAADVQKDARVALREVEAYIRREISDDQTLDDPETEIGHLKAVVSSALGGDTPP
jgi:hypothetical protein